MLQRWFAIVDELTAHTGLVTSEIVPAYRARDGDRLELAGPLTSSALEGA